MEVGVPVVGLLVVGLLVIGLPVVELRMGAQIGTADEQNPQAGVDQEGEHSDVAPAKES